MKRETKKLIIFSLIIIAILLGVIIFSLSWTSNSQERQFLLQHQDREFTQNMEETTSAPLLLKFPLYCYNQSCQISKELNIYNIIGTEVEVQVRITDNQDGKEILRENAENLISLFPTDQLLINSNISYNQGEQDPVTIFYYILPKDTTYSISVNEYF